MVTAYRSARVVLPTGVQEATVLVEGERIAEVVAGPKQVAGAVDFGDRVLGPGLVDCHVHINEPGRTEWEGFETATNAAAAGGVTVLVDMPLNSLPVTTTRAALEAKKQASQETTRRLGELALASFQAYGATPAELMQGIGLAAWGDGRIAQKVHARVQAKLEREAVEDFRIDFEDGFGARPDAEEDATAVRAAAELARAVKEGLAPPFVGIRIKSFGEEWARRGARTLELFIDALLRETSGALPRNFVVTLPKVTLPEQPRTLVRLLEILEKRHGLEPGALRFELMVETTQALVGPDGYCPLPALLAAGEGRCVGAHLGTYDFTASCNITAAHQAMDHPMCDLAKGLMLLAFAGTGLMLSDGATNVMPVPPHRGAALTPEQIAQNREAVHSAWRLSHRHIRHSLEGGYYQGWDLHPAQLPVRYAACYAFFLEGLGSAAERLKNFIEKAAQATLVGDVFDDAATGQGLLNYFLRALNCGAIELADIEQTGLTAEEVELRSFAKILSARRARLGG